MYNINSLDDNTLSKSNILKYVSEYDIFSYYLGKHFTIGEVFNSPLRKDKHPSFGIFKANNGHLLFKDLGTGDSGDCFKFVKLLLNKANLKHAITEVFLNVVTNSNFKRNTSISYKHTDKFDIGLQIGKFANYDLEYWKQYNITESILKYFNVYKAYKVYNKDKVIRIHFRNNPIYAYKINNSYKIYMPFAKEKHFKWLSNITIDDIFGLKQLPDSGDTLIISKAAKDVMLWYSIGYPAICPSTEGSYVPEKILTDLQKRFKKIIVWYDNDSAGLNYAKKMHKKYDLPYKYIPKQYNEKDLTDYCAEYGIDETKKLINTILNEKKEKKTTK